MRNAALLQRRTILGGLLALSGSTMATPLLAQTRSSKRLSAFCIGTNKYHNLTDLQTARADAEAVGGRLSSIGYEVRSAIDANIDLCLDQFGEFLDTLGPNTAAFVFAACHGIQVRGRNYILPTDISALDDPDALSRAMALDNLLDSIARAAPYQTIVVLDACRNRRLGLGIEGSSNGLASTNAPGGCFVAYSSSVGEYALDRLCDDDPSPNGLFTRYLLDELQPEATILTAVHNTRAKVIPAAKAIGHPQHPAIYDQSRWQFRIDGGTGGSSLMPSRTAGGMEGVGVVIASQHNYCRLGNLPGVGFDAERLGDAFRRLGSDVSQLIAPSRTDILKTCEEVGRAGYNKVLFWLAGHGQLYKDNACILLEGAGVTCTSFTRGAGADNAPKVGMDGIEIVTQSDIIAAFRNGAFLADEEETGVKGSPSKRQTPLVLFFDSVLVNGSEFQNDKVAVNPNLYDLQPGIDGPIDVGADAVITAASYFQPVLDMAEGQSSSAMTIAMLNALGHPGLTLGQLADRVRAEVESLTDRIQIPRFFGSRAMEDLVYVSPSENGEVSYVCPVIE